MFARNKALAVMVGLFTAASAASGCSDGDAAASGEVVVYSIASISGQVLAQPEYKAAAEAAVEKINSDGGVNGKKLKVVFCDTKLDPNIEAGCVRQAIAAKAAALVGGLEAYPDTLKQLEAAKIPYIGNAGFTPGAYDNPISFPLASGPIGAEATIAQMVKAGSKKIGILTIDAPGAVLNADLLKAAAESANVEVSSYVKFDPTTTDFTSSYAKLLQNGTDGVALITGANTLLLSPKALQDRGYSGIKSSSDGSLTDSTPGSEALKALDSYYLSGVVPWPSAGGNPPALQNAIDAIEKYAPGTLTTPTALQQYAAFMLFAGAMKSADTIDAATVLDTFTHLSTPVETGLIGPYSVVGKENRLFNDALFTGQVRGGEIVPDSAEPRPLSEILGEIGAKVQYTN